MKWTVGIITAPRETDNYLPTTLESLKNCGFENPVVFAEPGSQVPANTTVVYRRKKFGDWTNWATGLYELLLSEPDTDLFLMTEDDAIFCHEFKIYIEYAIQDLKDFGSISLYTPSTFRRCNFRGFHNGLKGMETWSTVTVIMTRDKVISFFSDADVQKHRFENIFGVNEKFWRCPRTDPKNSIKDAVIGKWAFKNNLPIYYHTPSLAEHIGKYSTLTDQLSEVSNGRMSYDFVGEKFSLKPWLENPVEIRKQNSIIFS